MCNRILRSDLDEQEIERLENYEASEGISILEVVRSDGQIFPTLINGKQVDRSDWLQVVRIGSRSCTATLVGPNCALTAAHCGENGSRGPLEIYNGPTINYTVVRMPQYKNGSNFDLSVLVLDSDADVPFATVGLDHTFITGQDVDILGYGCVRPGGGGGNDGVLRFGESRVTGMTGTDVVTSWRPGGAALCFGDSGGPMMANDSNTIIAINSKGNIRDTNYNMRLNLEAVKDFLLATCSSHNLKMYGVNVDDEQPPLPPPNQPCNDAGKLTRMLAEREQEFADLSIKWACKFLETDKDGDRNDSGTPNNGSGPLFGL